MKRIYIITLSILFSGAVMAHPGSSNPELAYAGDTVIIKIGDGSEIVIVTKNKEEIQKLSEYDLNAIIADLQESIEEAEDNTLYLEMEDLSGEKYLKEQQGYETRPSDENLTFDERMERFEERMEDFEDKMDDLDGGDGNWENDTQQSNENSSSAGVQFNKDQKNKGTSYSFNIDFGMNNYLENGKFPDDNNALYAVKPFGSWNIALNWVNSTHVSGPVYLEWGPGVSWYNFKFENTDTRILKADDELVFYEAPLDANSIKSKIVASYVNISLVPMLDFGRKSHRGKFSFIEKNSRGFRFGFGGYGGYRIGSRTKFVTKENGDRQKTKDKRNFYLNNWRYGLRFQMGYRGIDFYANYDLNELFVEGRGPQLNAFSFGIVL